MRHLTQSTLSDTNSLGKYTASHLFALGFTMGFCLYSRLSARYAESSPGSIPYIRVQKHSEKRWEGLLRNVYNLSVSHASR